jgi:hypothetical protein
MQHDEDGGRQILRQVVDELLQRLDPSEGGADDDNIVVARFGCHARLRQRLLSGKGSRAGTADYEE